MTYRALLIGNSTFESDASLNPLNAPTKDVARLHQALIDPETGLFEDANVRLVSERKHDEILDELDEFFAAGRRDDLMLFYYSGHGLLDEHNHLYLCGRDTRSDRLARTGISDETVNTFIRGANSTRPRRTTQSRGRRDYRLTDEDIDLSAETLDDWLSAEVRGDQLFVTLRPIPVTAAKCSCVTATPAASRSCESKHSCGPARGASSRNVRHRKPTRPRRGLSRRPSGSRLAHRAERVLPSRAARGRPRRRREPPPRREPHRRPPPASSRAGGPLLRGIRSRVRIRSRVPIPSRVRSVRKTRPATPHRFRGPAPTAGQLPHWS